MGGINGHYLRNITENHAEDTERVIAAVAYATDASLLFDWCWDNKIPLTFYGRLDDGVAVSLPILKTFLGRINSGRFDCKLVKHHHAKVIWWENVGVYIGSANLTANGWYKNIEAGCYFPTEEVTDEMAGDIFQLFDKLKENAAPLSEELLEVMEKRVDDLTQARIDSKKFWNNTSISAAEWSGLATTAPKTAAEGRRKTFLEEWYSTLAILRDIGKQVCLPENRPVWVSDSAPMGSQVDQFLHAHYYQRTFDDQNRAKYEEFFQQNKDRRNEALAEALEWWRQLPEAPLHEDEMLNVTAPFLRSTLENGEIENMTYETFREVCMGVHAIRDYSRRVRNRAVQLSDDRPYTIPEKVEALSRRIWNDDMSDGGRVKSLLQYILYEGKDDELPERLWNGITDSRWAIDGLGVSALGELVGWVRSDRFPPRNGRTSKALRSLGYDVTVHVE